MATVGNLFINVKARTKSFRKKMSNVGATIKRLSVGFLNIAKKVAMFGAAITAVAVVAIVAFTRAGIKSVDMLGKTADKLGLLPKHLQALRIAATSTGITVETLDMALQRMARRVGEAAVGTGEAQGALRELGLDAKELNKLSTDQVFHRISDAMEGVTNAQDRLRLAMKLFDSEGAALHVTMKGGSAALKEYARINKELGMELETSQVKMVEKAATKLNFLMVVWRSLGDQLAVEFAPVLTLVAEKMLQFVKTAGGMGVVAEYVVLAIAKIGAAAWNMLLKVAKHWYEFKAAIFQVLADLYGVLGKLGIYDLALDISNELQKIAVENIFKADAFVPIEDIDKKMRLLKERMMGMGFDPASGKLEITGDVAAPNLTNTINSLQTAIGQFKVEGDTRDRWLGNLVRVETAALKTSRDILGVLKDNGGALT